MDAPRPRPHDSAAMAIRLGAAPVSDDPVDALLACHARIRSFSDLAVKLARATDYGLAERREAAGRVVRYFTEAFPKHVDDENESVLPRLRGRSPELDAALDAMAREHDEHLPSVRALVARCERFDAPDGAVDEALAAEAAALRAALEAHLAAEEAVILPALRALLTADERAALRSEFAARRAPKT